MQDFELIARGVILHKGKILVCKAVGHTNYFLPGGHIDFGEGAEQALKRELFVKYPFFRQLVSSL